MPDLSNWTYGHPSATSRLRDFPGGYRSDKSHTRAAWEQEHYFEDGSAGSAGVHKEGSGRVRIFSNDGTVPSVGTSPGEITYDENVGRLFYTGSDASFAEPLSAGTAFRVLVVGPQSLDTGSAWVLSYRTTSPDGLSRVSWHNDSNMPAYTNTPFLFYSVETTLAVGADHIETGYCLEADASGGTFFASFTSMVVGVTSSATTDGNAVMHVLSVGTMPRSLFS
jgi:hypothetical protein